MKEKTCRVGKHGYNLHIIKLKRIANEKFDKYGMRLCEY